MLAASVIAAILNPLTSWLNADVPKNIEFILVTLAVLKLPTN